MNQTKNTYSTTVRALACDSYDMITPAERNIKTEPINNCLCNDIKIYM